MKNLEIMNLDISSSGEVAVEDHSTALDEEKKKIRCNYCDKEVIGFYRLKHHLGGLGNDVTSCTKVPPDVKAQMRNTLLGKKKEKLIKEMGMLEHPELPLKRNLSPASIVMRSSRPRLRTDLCSTSTETAKHDAVHLENGSSSNGATITAGNQPRLADHIAASVKKGSCSSSKDTKIVVKKEVKVNDESVSIASNSVGNFFFEAGIDLSNVKLASFQRMIDCIVSCRGGFKAPKYDELKGEILRDELNIVNQYVENIKHSWGETGCSILLDAWNDQGGRSFIRFLVACPKGTIFLKSFDATQAMKNANFLYPLIKMVIDEVGAKNVIQLISPDKSKIFENAGRLVMDYYSSIFWTLCVDYGMDLIFQEFERLDHFKRVLNDAKTITRYIYSNELAAELLTENVPQTDLVRTSDLKSVASFLTLSNLFSMRDHLVTMFNSASWKSCHSASTTKGKNVAKLIKDPSFWAAAKHILLVTDPLLNVIPEINGGKQSMGFYYDSMDRAKLKILENLGDSKQAELYWYIIDQIWNGHIHSPLHATGYYLNPRIYYSPDFYLDEEISTGLMYTFARVAEKMPSQELLVLQREEYRQCTGSLGTDIAVAESSTLSPDVWWMRHGRDTPQLQSFAIKVLSQTCCSSARFLMKKDVTEKLHSNKWCPVEHKRLLNLEFIHCNSILMDLLSMNNDPASLVCHKEVDYSDKWFIE